MLTPDEERQAAELGWELCDVYDLAKKRWMLTVMPLDFPATSARDAQIAVVMQARQRVKVAAKALKLITNRSKVV